MLNPALFLVIYPIITNTFLVNYAHLSEEPPGREALALLKTNIPEASPRMSWKMRCLECPAELCFC